jgi:hypothetical protein
MREITPVPDDGTWSVVESGDWVLMDGFEDKATAEQFASGLLDDRNLCDHCGHLSKEPFARCAQCGQLNR